MTSQLDLISDHSKEKLTELPKVILDMRNLKMLFLEGNFIEKLPEDFFWKLPKLMWLDLRNNLLQELPRSIANHQHLENLLLTNNNMRALPNELGLVPKLKALQVADNPLVYPVRKIIVEGTKAIKNYLKDQYTKINRMDAGNDMPLGVSERVIQNKPPRLDMERDLSSGFSEREIRTQNLQEEFQSLRTQSIHDSILSQHVLQENRSQHLPEIQSSIAIQEQIRSQNRLRELHAEQLQEEINSQDPLEDVRSQNVQEQIQSRDVKDARSENDPGIPPQNLQEMQSESIRRIQSKTLQRIQSQNFQKIRSQNLQDEALVNVPSAGSVDKSEIEKGLKAPACSKRSSKDSIPDSVRKKLSDPKMLEPTIEIKKLVTPAPSRQSRRSEPMKIVHKVSRTGSKISLKSTINRIGIRNQIHKASDKMLTEGWLNQLRILLNDQERILQQERNLRALSTWRLKMKDQIATPKIFTDGSRFTGITAPYGVDPSYSKMPSREDLQKQLTNFFREKGVVVSTSSKSVNMDKLITDLMHQLKEMEGMYDETRSPRSEIEQAGKQIKTIMDIQKKLLELKTSNETNL